MIPELNAVPIDSAREARQLLRTHRYGVLSTLSKKFDGHPFGSIAPYLVDHDGTLLILISTLAEHTKNILHDPRVSLITHNQDDPRIQTQGRVTVVGRASRVADKAACGKRYLRYFPEAETYLAMHDFSFYRIEAQSIRYIGGFGKVHWVNAADYAVPPHALAGQEDDVLAQVNEARRDMLRDCCRRFHQCEPRQVEMLGLDCDGCDVDADGKVLRLDFDRPVFDAQQALAALEGMARQAA